jgi:outer membrane protein assembly factor BamA
MRFPVRFLLLSVLVCVSAASQTYSPKTVQFEGVPASDRAQLLQVTGLKPGTPVSKQEIETALGKLADSGAFLDVSYSVGPEALIIKLKPVEDNEPQPVRYKNFVWWDEKELEQLVEDKVPVFRGQAKLHGPVTEQVKDALVALMLGKGVNATVSAVSDPIHKVVVFQIDSPAVLFGELKPSEELKATGGSTAAVERRLKGTEFSTVETPERIHAGLLEVFQSGGFTNVAIDAPLFSTPRKVGATYVVDATVAIHKGETFKVTSVTFSGAPVGTEDGLRRAALVKVGGPASPRAAQLSVGDLEGEMAMHGYLAAKVTVKESADAQGAAYLFTVEPGVLYHLSGVDATAASPEIQKALSKEKKLKPGVVLDHEVLEAITEVIKELDPKREQRLSSNIQRGADGEAAVVLKRVELPPGMKPR